MTTEITKYQVVSARLKSSKQIKDELMAEVVDILCHTLSHHYANRLHTKIHEMKEAIKREECERYDI